MVDVSKTATYLASDLVTVYSNHKMLGIRLVSRTRKYSDIGLSIVKKGKQNIRVATTDQFYPLIQAEDGSSSPVTQEGSREMRALLTTLLFWGIMVSAPLV